MTEFKPGSPRVWTARLLVAVVFAVNVVCALQFVLSPGSYTAAYELAGGGARAAVQGIGVAFLMWNATYPCVIASPVRFRAVHAIVIAQQVIGLVGELVIYATLADASGQLGASILRFVAFDAAGAVLLLIAWVICRSANAQRGEESRTTE